MRVKVFMLQAGVLGEPIVILKSAPSDGLALRTAYEDITPGYHTNKKHRITLHPDGDLDPLFVDDLVTESYLLVVENLPKNQRPVDPEAFGQHA
ncbi:MmcQ/YjbR family DNA-binding protein [Bacillus mobilis]|uniref:MmcQ/YjbR family DNA-binding protein n=1 Tax=Bacillus mobilis TaxID=2026190 RepID=UPI003638CAEB